MNATNLPEATVVEPRWLGVDVSKESFDAALWLPETFDSRGWRKLPTRKFDRTAQGARECHTWARSQLLKVSEASAAAIRVVMEATGKYSLELGRWFNAADETMAPAIINPRLAKAFSESLAITNRTDKADARTLAYYGAERKPAAYAPPEGNWAQLQDLTRYRQALVEEKQAEENRAGESSCSTLVRQTQARRIKQLERDIAKLDKQIQKLVDSTPAVKHDAELLDTIPGVGAMTAATILGELGDLRRFKRARQLTAFAGLAPTHHDSGTSVRKKSHLSKNGPVRVRRILYLAAMATLRTKQDNPFSRLYYRLTAAGKPHKVASAAVMRKILTVMRAILIANTPYDNSRGGA
jgi:transposase